MTRKKKPIHIQHFLNIFDTGLVDSLQTRRYGRPTLFGDGTFQEVLKVK
jgi:hypothetical protein